jgi:hypothetical protein
MVFRHQLISKLIRRIEKITPPEVISNGNSQITYKHHNDFYDKCYAAMERRWTIELLIVYLSQLNPTFYLNFLVEEQAERRQLSAAREKIPSNARAIIIAEAVEEFLKKFGNPYAAAKQINSINGLNDIEKLIYFALQIYLRRCVKITWTGST